MYFIIILLVFFFGYKINCCWLKVVAFSHLEWTFPERKMKVWVAMPEAIQGANVLRYKSEDIFQKKKLL